MDAEKDDSGGSDSLDKSLQKKCVVDVGQGEGASTSKGDCEKSRATDQMSPDPTLENVVKQQKTEKDARDTSESGVLDTGWVDSGVESGHNAGANRGVTWNDEFAKEHTSQDDKHIKENINVASSSHNIGVSSSMPADGSEISEIDSSMLSANDSIDNQDNLSKKVRFNPDVKDNDGGNRIIPKKNKKLKRTGSGDNASGSRVMVNSFSNTEEEIALDEEPDDDEEFDLMKTIAETENYLKSHPLSFVRGGDKNSTGGCRLKSGLLQYEDLPKVTIESSEKEDFYEDVLPENCVARILGKQMRGGKAKFLLRYIHKPNMLWKDEEFVLKNCPNLLSKYETNRDKCQEHLMGHLAKRQNLRQRYTDF